uniref:NADH-ubiquinone oxidoreductase chain 5 n=1 Tax=Timema californicum TaxID=61474 RepID=Q2Q1H5_TIMCA|nr:NADH dehydrogenase subunit 5 [Timema californicum]
MLFGLSLCMMSFVFLMFISIILFSLGINFLVLDLVYFIEWELISFNSCSIVMTLLIDWMSLMFMSFVLFISSLVIMYSEDYMSGDDNINRFILLVLMFVLSMMFMIISPNLISILLGWDGLGLVSYCLVIYYQNVKSYNAGMLTALSNRIGDVALLMAISWMLNFGSWNYIFYLYYMSQSIEMGIIMLLVVLACMTKSAQIPFSSWLPAAMAAPTPVSALVHSSTLVTAGVYLLIRFSPSLSLMDINMVLLLIASMTMFMSGLGANYEYDLKKIIALSTLSQLGLMMSILSMGYEKLAFFHLLTHALFKALLFMCAGSYIHGIKDCQDIRCMGNFMFQMPLSSLCFCISNLSLCGGPFLSGFYSKDLILEMSCLSYLNVLSFFLLFFSTGLTVSYTFRLIYYLMIKDFSFNSFYSMGDENFKMLCGMMSLLLMVVLGGSMLSWLLFPNPSMICLPMLMKLLTLCVCLMGGWFGYLLNSYFNMFLYSLTFYKTFWFTGSMWFMPLISTHGLNNWSLYIGSYINSSSDFGWLEDMGAQGMYQELSNWSKFNQSYQYNDFKIYLMGFILWSVTLMMLFII